MTIKYTTATARWQALSAKRTSFIDRCETYAEFTLPKVCPPDNYDQNDDELSHDYQALGAQAVNHLANKIILAAFAPSRPFFRADPDDETAKEIAENGLDATKVAEALALIEKEAVRKLDQFAMRPKLYEVIKHLIVTGNVMLYLDEETPRVCGLKKYTVRRSASGTVVEIMLADKVMFDELEPEVQDQINGKQPDSEVTHYRWIKRNRDGDYEMTQWVDEQQLPQEFYGKWPEAELPYRALTWDLSDGAHYGTGLVEDYRPDFAALSALSRAQVMGAVLASEFRWLANPAGQTKPDDLQNSQNGSVLPGQEGDISIVQSGKSQDLNTTMAINAEYVNRIGRGFLMSGSMVRNAERVTAQEIRMLANELETALGGAYSRLAVDIQLPLARFLLRLLDIGAAGIEPTVVTGLDALSRTGDLEELQAYFADLAALANMPETLQQRIIWDEVSSAFASARRVKADAFIKNDARMQEEMQAAQQQALEQQAAVGAVDAAAQQGAQQGQQE
jgi:hypothetical protein